METRLIKRYDNRKLYDTVSSSYVSLEQIGDLIRAGEQVRIVDKHERQDLTARILTQVLLEEGRKKGESQPPTPLLHEWIRRSEEVLQSGFRKVREGVDEWLEKPIQRGLLKERKEHMQHVWRQIELLEESIDRLEKKLE